MTTPAELSLVRLLMPFFSLKVWCHNRRGALILKAGDSEGVCVSASHVKSLQRFTLHTISF
jgi:hypothetical protein